MQWQSTTLTVKVNVVVSCDTKHMHFLNNKCWYYDIMPVTFTQSVDLCGYCIHKGIWGDLNRPVILILVLCRTTIWFIFVWRSRNSIKKVKKKSNNNYNENAEGLSWVSFHNKMLSKIPFEDTPTPVIVGNLKHTRQNSFKSVTNFVVYASKLLSIWYLKLQVTI